jgi:HPt (histidine-containing phosphotransfer) domain-containing protein
MTANAMVGDREKCLSYGMNDYISKPIAVETLASVMEQWIDLHQPEKETLKVEPLASACIDLAQLRSFTEGDTDLERELIKAFADQSTININALLANQKCGKNLEWVEAAHMLKGGAASIGAEKLRSLCEIAQKMADAEASARIAKFEEIAAAYTHVEQALKREGLLT